MMISEPQLVESIKEKAEIYKLRVLAWDSSKNNHFINKIVFPDGFSDELDATATHWAIKSDDRIIGCVRTNLLNSLDDFTDGNAFKNFTIPSGQFVYFSRIAIHPDYQHNNLAVGLAKKIVDEFRNSSTGFALTLYTADGFAERFGFRFLGDTFVEIQNNRMNVKAFILKKEFISSESGT